MEKRKKNFLKITALGFLAAACGIVGAVTYQTALSAGAEEIAVHACGENEYCLVCDVAAQVNALPSSEEITLENAAVVTQQIHNIDRIKYDMTDEQFDEFRTLVQVENYGDVVRYDNAVSRLREFKGFTQFVVQKKFDLGDEAIQDTSEAEVSFLVRNVDTGEATALTLFDLGCETSALGADAYQMTADGWAFAYTMPVGTYEITELNTDKPITVNGRRIHMECASMSFNGETVAGNGITVTLGENERNVVTLSNTITYSHRAQDEEGNGISGITVTYTNDAGNEVSFQSDATGEFYGEFGEAMSLIDGTTYLFTGVSNEYCASAGCELVYDFTDMGAGYDENGKQVMTLTLGDRTTYNFVFYKHAFGALTEEQAETCEEDGVAAYYQCERCDAYFDEEQNATEWNALIIPASGHNYTNFTSNGDATCETDETESAECNNACGTITTRVAVGSASGHAYGELVEEKAATCEEDGVKAHYYCATCEKYFNEERVEISQEELILSALGHDYSAWIVTKEATKEEHGERKKVCILCGDIVVERTPMVEPLVKDDDLTVVFIVLGVVIVMGAVALVATKNGWSE